jgi:peptidoglycan/xylan/chitin deacetylase (PgdA/CDA1 family)
MRDRQTDAFSWFVIIADVTRKGDHFLSRRTLASVKSLVAAVFMIGGGLVLLSSCATTTPLLLQSQDFTVYKLQKGETPVTVAERFLGDPKKSWVVEEANKGASFKTGQIVVIPLKEENKAGLRADGFQVVPILCYHRFADDCEGPLCLPARIFDQQMKYLKENGYRAVTCGELLAFLEYRQALPEKAVVITLDDGYRSAYDIAYPILKKYGFTATLFIYTDFVGASRNAVTWDQLREMKAAGFEVGGHSVSHADLTQQRKGEDPQTYKARIERELRVSKQLIDKELRQNTIFLAFPYGRYDETILGMCERFGYKMAVSVERGSNPFFADPLTLRRNQILTKDMTTFISRLKTFQKASLR